jgi:hypothetical protein
MSQKLTTEEFIERAIKKHGNKYEYNKVIYLRSKDQVEIYCNHCRKYFWQCASYHLHGYGCSVCGRESSTKKQMNSWA